MLAIKPQRGAPRKKVLDHAILQAAHTLLLEKGRTGFTIDEVASLAHTSKPAVYRRWPNKTMLLIDLFDQKTAHYMIIADEGDVKTQVVAYQKQLWNSWQTNGSGQAYRYILSSIQADSRAFQFFTEEFLPRRRQYLFTILERAQQKGELQDRHLETIIDYIFGFNWYHLLTKSVPTSQQLDKLVQSL